MSKSLTADQQKELQDIVDRRDHDRRGHERLTADRRRKTRQTYAMFAAHVEAYCERKKRK